MLARAEEGVKVLLMFFPGGGILPEIKFFSLDYVLGPALPEFAF